MNHSFEELVINVELEIGL